MHQELELQDDKVKKLEQLLKQKDDEIQTKECIIERVKGELQQTQDKLKEEEVQCSLLCKTVEKGKEDAQKLEEYSEYIETFEMEKRKLNKRIRDLEKQLGKPHSISPQPTVVHGDPEQAIKVTVEQQSGGELEQSSSSLDKDHDTELPQAGDQLSSAMLQEYDVLKDSEVRKLHVYVHHCSGHSLCMEVTCV